MRAHTHGDGPRRPRHIPRPRRVRRGFNLVELLMALSITATLLTATMVALDASFMAYQNTTEVASTHTISRLAMHRILTMIRTGQDFRPRPLAPQDRIEESDFIDFRLPGGNVVTVEWDQAEEALYIRPGGAGNPRYLILEGVIEQFYPTGHPREGELIMPFTLEYELGFELYRATIDIAVQPDDNMNVGLDGNRNEIIRLVATSMPRGAAHE